MSQSIPTPLTPSNNLSDVASAASARSNLGLGTAATQASTDFDAAGAASAAQAAAIAAAEGASCQRANSLSDVASAGAARTNLGLGTAATQASSDFLQAANNLSDVASNATARTNLGLGSAATQASTTFLQSASNLSDVPSAATARTNLGLGSAATQAAGSAGGVATLDGAGHLTSSQIPSSLVGAVVYQGTWNASTNSPTLSSGGGGSSSKGNYYVVSVAGTTTLDGISTWNPGDAVISDGTAWEKIDGVASEVLSFNGRTGTVTPQSGDYSAGMVGLGNVTNNLQLVAANNLSDLASAATARTNLGLGSAATQSSSAFDAAGAAAAAQSAAEAACCQTANNLSDVASAATAATNLGLGTASSPTFAGLTVAGPATATHFVGGGPAPTAATGSAAGSGGSLGVTITGSDASMQVALTTGNTATGAGTLFTVSFGTAFAAAPNPVFSPTTAATAALTVSKQFYITASTSGITFSCGVGLSTNSTYTWNIKL